jgi:hypothetical protein
MAWHLSKAELTNLTKVDSKSLRLELIDPVVLCPKDCERPRKIRTAVQQYSAASSMLPIVYAANLSVIAGFSFESIAHVQEVALEWLAGGNKNILEFQHSELKRAYFASISEPNPRYPDRDGKPGGQAFSAALPTEELRRRVKPTFTKQFTGRGLSSTSLAKHVYMNSALDNPDESLAKLDWVMALDFLFGDDEESKEHKPGLPPQPLPLLSEQIARNEIGLQNAQAESTQSTAPQQPSRAMELDAEFAELKRSMGENAGNPAPATPQDYEVGPDGCLTFSSPENYLNQCSKSLGSPKSATPGSSRWNTGQIIQVNRCVGLNKEVPAQRLEYKRCWDTLFRAFHPDVQSESDSGTADQRAEALRTLIYYRDLVRNEFL